MYAVVGSRVRLRALCRPGQEVRPLNFQAFTLLTPNVRRFTGAILLEIVYGHAVTSVKDDLIRLSDEMMTQAVSAGSLVATLLDFFPFRTLRLALSRLSYSHISILL